jgi:hypothetical protein
MQRFFGAAPPILAASTADKIATQMRRVVADPEQIGRCCSDWARQYHSTERIVVLQVAAYERLLSHRGRPAGGRPPRRTAGRHWDRAVHLECIPGEILR